MLEIVQTKNYERYSDEIKTLGLEECYPNVAEAKDGDSIIGRGIYHFEPEKIVVDSVDAGNDLYLYDGIVRSILFLAVMKGIDTAEFRLTNDSNSDNAVKLGFVQNGNNLLTELGEFMSKCKSCGNNQ